MTVTTGLYVALGLLVFAVLFGLALARAAAHADECSERLLADYRLRELTRSLQAPPNLTIEARRLRAGEMAGQLSRRRTWQSPSSA